MAGTCSSFNCARNNHVNNVVSCCCCEMAYQPMQPSGAPGKSTFTSVNVLLIHPVPHHQEIYCCWIPFQVIFHVPSQIRAGETKYTFPTPTSLILPPFDYSLIPSYFSWFSCPHRHPVLPQYSLSTSPILPSYLLYLSSHAYLLPYHTCYYLSAPVNLFLSCL